MIQRFDHGDRASALLQGVANFAQKCQRMLNSRTFFFSRGMDPFRGLPVSFHIEDGAERIEGTDENVIGSCQCPEFLEIFLPENGGELCQPRRRSRSRS